jgi:hypothetical protein
VPNSANSRQTLGVFYPNNLVIFAQKGFAFLQSNAIVNGCAEQCSE